MELTDEQIEKALSCCQWALKNCKECPLDPQKPCFTNLHLATTKYIERLKDAIESAVQSFTKLDSLYKIKCAELECAEEKAQRKTAISIMQIIMENCTRITANGENIVKIDLAVFDKTKQRYKTEENDE